MPRIVNKTIDEIQADIINDIETKFGQIVPILPKAVFRVLAYVLAAIWVILYKFGAWLYLQIFVTSGDEEAVEYWGVLVGITRVAATAWQGVLELGVITTGGTLLAGTQFVNTDTQIVYISTSDVSLSSSNVIVPLKSVTLGFTSNLDNGTELKLATPLSALDDFGTITSTSVTAIDKEDLEDYRARVINRYKNPPQGGALSDYVIWSTEVSNVINAYPYVGSPGEVDVYIEVNDKTDGLADVTDIFNVEDSINQPDRRPVTAVINVASIVRTDVNITITTLDPDTSQLRSDIEEALTDYLLGREPFIAELATIDKSKIDTSRLTGSFQPILDANNASIVSLTFDVGSGTITTYTLGDGEKAKLGSLTFA